MKKIIFFLIDGIADKGVNTPLRNAQKNFINSILKRSFLSYIYPLTKEYWPSFGEFSVSGLANLSILGYKIKPEKFKRGVYEAIGSGIKYKNGWLAIRANFATVDENLRVIDRRAGREIYGLNKLAKDINSIKFEIPFNFYHTLGHRGVLVFKHKLSDNITTNDPYSVNKKVKKINPLDSSRLAIKTSLLLNKFLDECYKLLKEHSINKIRIKKGFLPANYLLLREAGSKKLKLTNFFKKYKFKNGIVLATNGVDKGTCISVGFKEFTLEESTDIENELKIASQAYKKVYKNFQVIYIHLKKADEAAHDKNFEKKKNFFEKFDKFLSKIFNYNDIFVITGDHITDTKSGKHKFGPVPLLIINSKKINNPKEFSEKEALKLGIYFKENSNIWKFLKENVS